MNNCPECSTQVIPGAKFCHRCGSKMAEHVKNCPACSGKNPLSSVFCHDCGFQFENRSATGEYQPRYTIDFSSLNLVDQVKALFFSGLRERVLDEHDISKYPEFVERFYQSSFKEIYEVRAAQIAKIVAERFATLGKPALPEIDERLQRSFEGLYDYFIIQYCPDLHGFVLPEAILRHEQARPGKTDLCKLIADYLDLGREKETVYTNFVSMPEPYLVNACKQYLFAERKEKVYFILDLSIKGNCKEGFAMTDKGLYWKMPFDKPKSVHYNEVKSLKKEKDWVLINQQFFTANGRLNLKLYKLMKKLKGWKEPAVTAS